MKSTPKSQDCQCLCLLCEAPLRVERRGDEWFAWCNNGPWGIGCKCVSGFGESRELATNEALKFIKKLF